MRKEGRQRVAFFYWWPSFIGGNRLSVVIVLLNAFLLKAAYS
jgi:hypothetical protein